MAITIRNKKTEAMVREIGRRRGEGPSAVIRRLAAQELGQTPSRVSRQEYERRMGLWDELDRKYPPPADRPSWVELQAEMDAIFDYLEDEKSGDDAGQER